MDTLDEKGLSGLMWAAGYGQLGSARQLLEAGADKNCRGHQGQTPLHLASAYGHHDLVKLLLSHGADPNLSEEVVCKMLENLPFYYLFITFFLIEFILYVHSKVCSY